MEVLRNSSVVLGRVTGKSVKFFSVLDLSFAVCHMLPTVRSKLRKYGT
jgi:hypothetical protein